MRYSILLFIVKAKELCSSWTIRKHLIELSLIFLDKLLALRGFHSKLFHWIHLATRGGSVAVKLNGTEGKFFPQEKGLGKGTLCHMFCSI
jgi:hypothetical protein